MPHNMLALLAAMRRLLNGAGAFLAPLGLRLLLAWEFWEAGVSKLHGENWFSNIQGDFPFPFNLVSPAISWRLAMWTELAGAIALIIGLGARFFSAALIILTVVAWASVHAGHGYNVCDNGFKLPLMYLVMFLPLLLSGPGKASIDHWLWRRLEPRL